MGGKYGKWMGVAKQAMDKMSDDKGTAKDKKTDAKPEAQTGATAGTAEKVMKQVGRRVDDMMDRKRH